MDKLQVIFHNGNNNCLTDGYVAVLVQALGMPGPLGLHLGSANGDDVGLDGGVHPGLVADHGGQGRREGAGDAEGGDEEQHVSFEMRCGKGINLLDDFRPLSASTSP